MACFTIDMPFYWPSTINKSSISFYFIRYILPEEKYLPDFTSMPLFASIMHQHSLFCDIIVLIVLDLQIIDLDKGRENNLILNDNDGIIFQLQGVIDSICFWKVTPLIILVI